MKRVTSIYADDAISAPWDQAAKAQGIAKGTWLEEAVLLVAPLSGAPVTPLTVACRAWVRLRAAGNRAESDELRTWALLPAVAREPLSERVVLALTEEERTALLAPGKDE